jgi:hypothetical protein
MPAHAFQNLPRQRSALFGYRAASFYGKSWRKEHFNSEREHNLAITVWITVLMSALLGKRMDNGKQQNDKHRIRSCTNCLNSKPGYVPLQSLPTIIKFLHGYKRAQGGIEPLGRQAPLGLKPRPNTSQDHAHKKVPLRLSSALLPR